MSDLMAEAFPSEPRPSLHPTQHPANAAPPRQVGSPRQRAFAPERNIPPVVADPPLARLPDTNLPPLRITQFGRFKIIRGSAALLPCRARKAVALFRFLLNKPDYEAHRDELTALLWSEVDQREAGHSLHVAVSALRKYLDAAGSSYLHFEAGFYRINADAKLDLDVEAFRQSLAEARRFQQSGALEQAIASFQQALSLYTGDFSIDGLDDIWALAERERWLIIYLQALEDLGGLHEQSGDDAAALGPYRALLERDGYREDIHARVMQCYWRIGRRHEAIRQFELCARKLRIDLGIEPMPALTHLLSRIKSNDESERYNRVS